MADAWPPSLLYKLDPEQIAGGLPKRQLSVIILMSAGCFVSRALLHTNYLTFKGGAAVPVWIRHQLSPLLWQTHDVMLVHFGDTVLPSGTDNVFFFLRHWCVFNFKDNNRSNKGRCHRHDKERGKICYSPVTQNKYIPGDIIRKTVLRSDSWRCLFGWFHQHMKAAKLIYRRHLFHGCTLCCIEI